MNKVQYISYRLTKTFLNPAGIRLNSKPQGFAVLESYLSTIVSLFRPFPFRQEEGGGLFLFLNFWLNTFGLGNLFKRHRNIAAALTGNCQGGHQKAGESNNRSEL